MLQQFFLKQMLTKQLANLPKDQQEKVLEAFDKNPDFFSNLTAEIGIRIKNGESQMSAIMAVVNEHKVELQKLLQP